MYGIYQIRNKINNKVYIGQTTNLSRRKVSHFRDLKNNKHINKHLQNSYNKYGEDNFVFEILEQYTNCEIDYLTLREQYWIDYYGGLNSNQNYNKRDASSRGTNSIETRQKISKIHKGKKVVITDETRQKISKALKGRPAHNKGIAMPAETRQKISQTLKGHKPHEWTKECRDRLSKALKGKSAWNKGKTMSYKGVPRSEEFKLKMREKHKNRGYCVEQYDIDGNLIAIYPTTMEAERQTGIKNSNISACCRGLQPKAGGFIWKRKID